MTTIEQTIPEVDALLTLLSGCQVNSDELQRLITDVLRVKEDVVRSDRILGKLNDISEKILDISFALTVVRAHLKVCETSRNQGHSYSIG